MNTLATTLLAVALLAPAFAEQLDSDRLPHKELLYAAFDEAIIDNAARELDELEQTHAPASPYREEWLGLIGHYRRTGDAKHASEPHRFTMLHLACLHHKPFLASELLKEGADPNAQRLQMYKREKGEGEGLYAAPGDSPLAMVFRPRASDSAIPPTPEDVLEGFVEMLAEHGADMKGMDASVALYTCENESVIVHLLDKGADPGVAGELVLVDGNAADQRLDFFLHSALNGHLSVMEYMLKQGMVSPNGTADVESDTVLNFLCRNLSRDAENNPFFEQQAPAIALLLRHGADTRFSGLAHPGKLTSSPADYIYDNPRLLASLKAQGIEVHRTFRHVRPECLEADIAALPSPVHPQWSEEEAAELWPLMAELLRTPATNETGRQARRRCPELMRQIDPERTREFLNQLTTQEKP